MQEEYSLEQQRLYLEIMMQDHDSYIRVQRLINEKNFDRSLRPAVTFIQEHVNKHGNLPDHKQLKAVTNVDINEYPDLAPSTIDWFMDSFESFTKRKEMERAIVEAAGLIEKKDGFPEAFSKIAQAYEIKLTKDMGTDYFADPKRRLEKYFNSGGQVSTGWPTLDKLLHGGFSRGELNIFAGGSGSGKSLVMLNVALSWLQAGLNGVYISLELSEELCGLRTDAMLTNASTRDIRKDLDNTVMRVKMMSKSFGQYRIKQLPAQSTPDDIKAYLKEVEIQLGMKVDFIMVDYLDLLMPAKVKVNLNDQFIKDKYVSEELRNLATELNVLMITASQLNRTAVDEVDFDHSHIAGGISKINTADNVFGIFTSRAMRERGRYQIQCMKSRSSNGVGQKIDLEYNVETMRITDLGEDQQQSSGFIKKPNVYEQIKAKSTISSAQDPDINEEETGKIVAKVDNNKLKSLLGQIKTTR